MTICERCYKPLDVGEHGHMLCPLEARRRSTAVWQDTIEGGLMVQNAICNEDGTPRRFDSWTEYNDACKAKGVIPYHEAFAEEGNRVLSDARVHDDWLKSSEAKRARRDRDEIRAEKKLAQSRVGR